MPYNAQQMQQAADTLTAADGMVRHGLLFIGEHHKEAHGRGLVANLIQRGLVDNLFLEIYDRFEMGVKDGGSTKFVFAEKWLQEQAAERTDLRNSDTWRSNQLLFRAFFVTRGFDGKNPVPFTRLIEFAVLHGVRIHFIDTDPGQHSPETRSGYMRKKLDEAKPGAKSVFLVGSHHLTHESLRGMPHTSSVLCIGA
jgi:hypothetical protein